MMLVANDVLWSCLRLGFPNFNHLTIDSLCEWGIWAQDELQLINSYWFPTLKFGHFKGKQIPYTFHPNPSPYKKSHRFTKITLLGSEAIQQLFSIPLSKPQTSWRFCHDIVYGTNFLVQCDDFEVDSNHPKKWSILEGQSFLSHSLGDAWGWFIHMHICISIPIHQWYVDVLTVTTWETVFEAGPSLWRYLAVHCHRDHCA